MPVTPEMLDSLFVATVESLTEKIEAGMATAGDFSAAIKLLKDNGIVLDDHKGDLQDELNKIVKKFSFEDVEEYDMR